MPCVPTEEVSGKPDAMLIFRRPGKTSSDERQQKRWDRGETAEAQCSRIRTKIRVQVPPRYGAYARLFERCDDNSTCQNRSRHRVGQVEVSTGLELPESQS